MYQKAYDALKIFETWFRSKHVDADMDCVSDCFAIWTAIICDVAVNHRGEQRALMFLADWQNVLAVRHPYEILEFVDMIDSLLLRFNYSHPAFLNALKDHLLSKPSDRIVYDVFQRHFLFLLNRWFCRRETGAFRDLHQIFSFPLRLTLEGTDLEKKASSDYRQTIARIQELRSSVGGELCDIMVKWFPREWEPSRFREFSPVYGPGVTSSTSRRAYEKDQQLFRLTPLSDYYIRSRGLQEWFPSYPWYRKTGTFKYVPLVDPSLTTKIIFVPKNWKKKRTISAEPASSLYFQQGIKSALLGFVHHPSSDERRIIRRSTKRSEHPLKRRYRPDDQEANRLLAWEGSIDGSFATIDLSSASDSVGLQLVKNAFRHTGLLPALLCSRTSRATLPDGECLTLASYGPMGNALTFPIETYVFCACCELAIQSTGDSSDVSRYVVYGDDIVIEVKYVEPLLECLKSLGFLVNEQKSFFDPMNLFRESCGAEWLHGDDVLPVRIPRGFKTLRFGRHDPGLYHGVIELANSLFRFSLARRFVIDKLFSSVSPTAIPFSPDGELGLYSTTASNYQLERSMSMACELDDPYWWHGLQRPIPKVWTASGDRRKEIASLSDKDHFFSWYCYGMRQAQVRSDTLRLDVPWRPWVPMAPTLLCRKHTSAQYPLNTK